MKVKLVQLFKLISCWNAQVHILKKKQFEAETDWWFFFFFWFTLFFNLHLANTLLTKRAKTFSEFSFVENYFIWYLCLMVMLMLIMHWVWICMYFIHYPEILNSTLLLNWYSFIYCNSTCRLDSLNPPVCWISYFFPLSTF